MSTLVIVSHLHLATSRAHRHVLGAIAGVRGVAVRHLDALYPDGRIDAAIEQAAVLPATRIVFLFPCNWYSMPPVLKAWQDEVLTVGFDYGPGGARMRGKRLQIVLTAGAARDSYCAGGHNLFEVTDLLKPLLATVHFVGKAMLPPLVPYHVSNVPRIPAPADIDACVHTFALQYRDLLAAPEAAMAALPR